MKYVKVKQNTKSGFAKCGLGGVVDLAYPGSKTRRGRVQGGGWISPTVTTTPALYRIEEVNETNRNYRN